MSCYKFNTMQDKLQVSPAAPGILQLRLQQGLAELKYDREGIGDIDGTVALAAGLPIRGG